MMNPMEQFDPVHSTDTLYRKPLAWIHHRHYGDYSRNAAPGLLTALRRAGIASGTIVDLGCGGGLWPAEAHGHGYETIGIDGSSAMIELARTTLPSASWIHASIYDAKIPPCRAITAIGEVLNYQPPKLDHTACRQSLFQRSYEALAPGGLLIFDILVSGRPLLDYRTWKADKTWALMLQVTEDLPTKTLCREIVTFRRQGGLFERHDETHRLSVYDAAAIEHELREIGFTVRSSRKYGQFALPLRRKALIARKPK